jgi:hypothetical protein
MSLPAESDIFLAAPRAAHAYSAPHLPSGLSTSSDTHHMGRFFATFVGRSDSSPESWGRRSEPHPGLAGGPRWIVLCLLVLATACSSTEVKEQPATDLPLPPSGYAGLAWLTDGTLVVADPGRITEDATSRLLFLSEPRTGAYEAVAAKGDRCLAHEFLSPVALADGSVAFQEMCGVETRLPAT